MHSCLTLLHYGVRLKPSKSYFLINDVTYSNSVGLCECSWRPSEWREVEVCAANVCLNWMKVGLAHIYSSLSRCWMGYHTCIAALQNCTMRRLKLAVPKVFPSPICLQFQHSGDSQQIPEASLVMSNQHQQAPQVMQEWKQLGSCWLVCANVFSVTSGWFFLLSWSEIISDVVQQTCWTKPASCTCSQETALHANSPF